MLSSFNHCAIMWFLSAEEWPHVIREVLGIPEAFRGPEAWWGPDTLCPSIMTKDNKKKRTGLVWWFEQISWSQQINHTFFCLPGAAKWWWCFYGSLAGSDSWSFCLVGQWSSLTHMGNIYQFTGWNEQSFEQIEPWFLTDKDALK